MRIIFLDFDGVLVNRAALLKGSGYSAYGAPECVAALNKIIDATGAYIVVSSAHRMGCRVEELQKRLDKWGVRGRVIDKTPVHWQDPRGVEIYTWLKNSQDRDFERIESFVILDDDVDMVNLIGYLVKTEFEVGLTEADADRAISILESPAGELETPTNYTDTKRRGVLMEDYWI